MPLISSGPSCIVLRIGPSLAAIVAIASRRWAIRAPGAARGQRIGRSSGRTGAGSDDVTGEPRVDRARGRATLCDRPDDEALAPRCVAACEDAVDRRCPPAVHLDRVRRPDGETEPVDDVAPFRAGEPIARTTRSAGSSSRVPGTGTKAPAAELRPPRSRWPATDPSPRSRRRTVCDAKRRPPPSSCEEETRYSGG